MGGGKQDYEFQQQLGRGSFGTVYKVRRLKDRRTFVCKTISLETMTKKAREEANQEVTLLRRISKGSPYIVKYVESFLDSDMLYIFMEYCENGDLAKYLKAQNGKNVAEQVVWKFLVQIACGLAWIHSQRILHRDVKTMNVFLATADDVRIGDLGVARVLSHNTQFANTFVGTPYYLSPELCEEKPYNEKSDVWAFGCVLYEVCTLRHPFEARNHAALLIKILRGHFEPVPASLYSSALRSVVSLCMSRDLANRPTLQQLLALDTVKSQAAELGISTVLGESRPPVEGGGELPAIAKAKRSSLPLGRMGAKTAVGVAGAPAQKGAPSRPPRAKAAISAKARPKMGGYEEKGAAPMISAPPSSSGTQAIRIAPAQRRSEPKARGTPAQRPVAGVLGDKGVWKDKALEREQEAALEREREREESRLAAAREVAALPDVLVPADRSKPKRNVPSVHELLSLDSHEDSANQTSRLAAAESEGERTLLIGNSDDLAETMLPDGAQDETINPNDECAGTMLPTGPEEVMENSLLDPRRRPPLPRPPRPPGADSEGDLEDEGEEPVKEPTLRLLRRIDPQDVCEDSLCYTEGTSTQCTSVCYSPEPPTDDLCEDENEGDFLVEEDQEIEDFLDTMEPELQEEADEQLHSEAYGEVPSSPTMRDSSGLLCDMALKWGATKEDPHEDAIVEEIPPQPDFENLDAGGTAGVLEAALENCMPAAAEEKTPREESPEARKRAKLEKRLRSLGSQIKKLHADVVKDLDGPARAIWDELYGLFHSKMAADLTDDDQNEIERYVFEQLPTESTDLIWKVYKVLHLEQERDRCEKQVKQLEQL